MFTKFTVPVSGTLMEILGNDTKTRDKTPIKLLGVTKGEYGGVVMILKVGMKVAQDYNVFNYRTPIPQNNVNSKDRKIVEGTGVNLGQKVFLPGNSKKKVGKETPPDALLMDNLETYLATTVYKTRWNTGR